jgi:hypothetical protein
MPDIISLANSIIEIAAGIKNADLLKKVSELTLTVAQAEMENARLMRENAMLMQENVRLVQENAELKQRIQTLQEDKTHPLVLNSKNNFYFDEDDTGCASPYCPGCYESKHMRIHLTKQFICPQCRLDFYLASGHKLSP